MVEKSRPRDIPSLKIILCIAIDNVLIPAFRYKSKIFDVNSITTALCHRVHAILGENTARHGGEWNASLSKRFDALLFHLLYSRACFAVPDRIASSRLVCCANWSCEMNNGWLGTAGDRNPLALYPCGSLLSFVWRDRCCTKFVEILRIQVSGQIWLWLLSRWLQVRTFANLKLCDLSEEIGLKYRFIF